MDFMFDRKLSSGEKEEPRCCEVGVIERLFFLDCVDYQSVHEAE